MRDKGEIMKLLRIILYSTLPITLLILLAACTRTWPSGLTEEVGVWEATWDVIIGLPPKPGEESSTGLITLITALAGAGGFGWVRNFINKKNGEALRSIGSKEATIVKGRYQAIKEFYRNDPDTLGQIKLLSAQGAQLVRENMDMLEHHGDDIETFKGIYKGIKDGSIRTDPSLKKS